MDTIAHFFPLSDKQSKTVLHFSIGFTYSLIPCFSGRSPEYMDAKHTGVTGGTIDSISRLRSFLLSSGANKSLCASYIHSATASGLYIMTRSHFLSFVTISISFVISFSFSTPNRERIVDATLSIDTSFSPFISNNLNKGSDSRCQ